MDGIIANFRGGRHTQKGNQMIVHVKGISSREKAEALTGKKVTWKSPAGKELEGEVRGAHGSKGAVRVLFKTGMPGQSLTQKVSIQ